MRDTLAKALKLYTSGGASIFPKENAREVTAKYGPDVLEQIEGLIAELGALRPDLSEEALEALGWRFSFLWK